MSNHRVYVEMFEEDDQGLVSVRLEGVYQPFRIEFQAVAKKLPGWVAEDLEVLIDILPSSRLAQAVGPNCVRYFRARYFEGSVINPKETSVLVSFERLA